MRGLPYEVRTLISKSRDSALVAIETYNEKFNAAMLAEAMCKLEGFTYAPSETAYWQHGHSTENDFIYVTTQTLTREQLQRLSDEVGACPNDNPRSVGREGRSLLVMCGAFRVGARHASLLQEQFPNLTVKKIPKAVLNRCEWGKDDYILEIKNLPERPAEEEHEPKSKPRSRDERRSSVQLPSLFDLPGSAK